MDALSNMLAVAVVSLLAAVSPGPDFFLVFKNSIAYSRQIGFFTAIGISLGLFIHLTYTLVGIGVLMTEDSYIYHLLKYAGAAYLFYIGLKGLISSFKKPKALNPAETPQPSSSISASTALKQGFLTNALNPKAALFFISLFSQFITEDTPMSLRISYAAVNWSVALLWFLFLSYLITGNYLMKRIDRFRTYIDRIMGSALILLSIRLVGAF